jgi:hypothetical protein
MSAEPAPSPGAIRMRRSRARRAKGMRCLTIELRDTEIESLIRQRWLAAEGRDDLHAIRRALYDFFDATFRGLSMGRCLEQGWTLAELFVEGDVLGSVPFARRPQGQRLLRCVLPGDIVVSAKLDRCFRSALDALATINDFRARGIHLWLNCSGNGISELMLTVLAAVAQFERVRLAERITDAKAESRSTGGHQGGAPRRSASSSGPRASRGRRC